MYIRPAIEADVPTLLRLIGELAEYERLSHEAVGTVELLRRYLFGESAVAEALLAEVEGEIAGFALFFPTFSSFLGRPGIWLEDLFVRPEHRKRGVGSAILAHVAQLAAERDCERLEWSALDWNEPALGFYRTLGARPMTEWTTQRLEGETLRRLAERPDSAGRGAELRASEIQERS